MDGAMEFKPQKLVTQKMRRKAWRRHRLTHEVIAAAIRRFEATGGLIRRLPDECEPHLYSIGEQYALYESPMIGATETRV